MFDVQKERETYEVIVENGKLVYKQSGIFVNTVEGSKWIFVLSTSRSLYVGKKKKGVFQHSSFLSGGATTAAGRLVARDGVLEVYYICIYTFASLSIHLMFSELMNCNIYRLFGLIVDTISQLKTTSRNSSLSLKNITWT